jgi:hypothetical protein
MVKLRTAWLRLFAFHAGKPHGLSMYPGLLNSKADKGKDAPLFRRTYAFLGSERSTAPALPPSRAREPWLEPHAVQMSFHAGKPVHLHVNTEIQNNPQSAKPQASRL